MTSPWSNYFYDPVRVLLRAKPTDIEKIDTCIEVADRKLIETLCVGLDLEKVQHLLTKQSDKKRGGERVDIVFDYRVTTVVPDVVVLKVQVKNSTPSFKLLNSPVAKDEVNRIIGVHEKVNTMYGLSFPRRIDVRKGTWKQRGLPDTPKRG
jgi:hypothetical protein